MSILQNLPPSPKLKRLFDLEWNDVFKARQRGYTWAEIAEAMGRDDVDQLRNRANYHFRRLRLIP